MKRRWLAVTLLVGVLALGITGGTVLAHEGGTAGDSPLGSFVSRVATILGLEEAQVQAAFDQARGEMRDEALEQRLDRLVEEGLLTPEQADEYREWYQSRPEGLSPRLPFRGFGGQGFHRGGMMGGRGMMGGGHGMTGGGMGFRSGTGLAPGWLEGVAPHPFECEEPPQTPAPDSPDATSL